MSLLLRRAGERENPESLRQLLEMDRAYAESIRLGATKKEKDYDEIMAVAQFIENKVKTGLEDIARGKLD